MTMTAAAPTLSHVRRIDTAYPVEAARSWTKTAHLWEQTFAGVHDRMSSPGGTPWTGEVAVAARQSSYLNLVKVRGASDQPHGAADVARRGVEQLRACKEAVLEAVEDARADGFDVGDDDGRNTVRAVDLHTFKEAPNPEPDPPPGGWSSDPLMRAAQKIAYGHASGPDGHMADFPNMTKDQLADLIYGKMKMSIENPGGLQLGASKSDGAPLTYDPKDNVLIVRDKPRHPGQHHRMPLLGELPDDYEE